jgi:prevent-host-death family protein
MADQPNGFGRPKLLRPVSTNELHSKLSEMISRAAFGNEPVLVMRRGRNIAAIISIADFNFLQRMKRRRDETMSEMPPTDQSEIGPALARQMHWEIFFG